jgi:hypothetical protein
LGTEKWNGIEPARIMHDGRSIGEEGTWRNPRGEEKPRTANEKMERHTGVNRSSAYKKMEKEKKKKKPFLTNIK